MEKKKAKIDIKDLRLEQIEPRYEKIIKEFKIDENSSEEIELKNFLIEDALRQEKMGITSTYLWFHNPTNTLVGYLTILVDAVRIHGTLLGKIFSDYGVPYKTLPALKIGRMCVHHDFKQKGIGTYMILFSMGQLIRMNRYAGCRFVVVDAKRNAVHFYKKMGFNILKERHKGTLPMYNDLIKIIRFIKENQPELKIEKVKK